MKGSRPKVLCSGEYKQNSNENTYDLQKYSITAALKWIFESFSEVL